MRFIDPIEVVCNSCGKSLSVRVAELLALKAVCNQCGASMADEGRRMHRFMDEATVQFMIMKALIDLEDELGLTIPDQQIEYDTIATKGQYVKQVVALLYELRPEQADIDKVADAFDRSLRRQDYLTPACDSTPLLEILDPRRFAARVSSYLSSAVK